MVMEQNNAEPATWDCERIKVRDFHSMIQDGELNLNPRIARNYVMGIKTASRLVESILIGLPISDIYLADEKDGIYSIIDGKQRLISLTSYVAGILPNKREFRLTGLRFFQHLNGKKFSDMNEELQNRIKNASITTHIMKSDSDDDKIQSDLFLLLNTRFRK